MVGSRREVDQDLVDDAGHNVAHRAFQGLLQDWTDHRQVAQAIHEAAPELASNNWHAYTSRLVHHPETAPPELIKRIEAVFGPEWKGPLLLIGANGDVNPEVILPAVLMNSIKPGLRGLLIVSLLAALMGSLTGSVNGASALFVRDIYQNFLRPRASNRELMFWAHASSIMVVLLGFVMGLTAPSINDLWGWLIMGLTAGALGPGLLRLYWWRVNAWGMTAGILFGGAAAVVQRLVNPGMSEWTQFLTMTLISFVATIVGSLVTAPTPEAVVSHFYRTTRPFGLWGPLWKNLPAELKTSWSREHRSDLLTAATALVWQVCLFLLPMQVLTKNWDGIAVTRPIFLCACVGLYFFWWRNLPPADEKIPDFVSVRPIDQAPLTVEAVSTGSK